MSYYAYDVHGYIGDLASGPGWHDFCVWARKQGGKLKQLADVGTVIGSKALGELATQSADAEADNASDDSIRKTVIVLARTADELLIVNNGEEN